MYPNNSAVHVKLHYNCPTTKYVTVTVEMQGMCQKNVGFEFFHILGILLHFWNQVLHNVICVETLNDSNSLIIGINTIPTFCIDPQVGLSLICSKIYLLFLPELPKIFTYYSYFIPKHHQLFFFYSIVSMILSQCRSNYMVFT